MLAIASYDCQQLMGRHYQQHTLCESVCVYCVHVQPLARNTLQGAWLVTFLTCAFVELTTYDMTALQAQRAQGLLLG